MRSTFALGGSPPALPLGIPVFFKKMKFLISICVEALPGVLAALAFGPAEGYFPLEAVQETIIPWLFFHSSSD